MALSSPSRVIINLDAYAENLRLVGQIVGERVRIIPIVKANAYGHGLEPIAKVAIQQPGVELLGVATVNEAIRLRKCGITVPILVLVQPSRDLLPLILEHNLTVVVGDSGIAEALGNLGKELHRVVPVHCKIDTGMGRQGINLDEAIAVLEFMKRITNIDIQGICTHFPTADVPEDAFTQEQIKAFKALIKQIDKIGIPYEMIHAANSAALVNYPESLFDAVRPGLMCYGIWPVATDFNRPPLRRVLRWETTVVQVRQLKPGVPIGYGRSFVTYGVTRTAILPVGYADGYKYQLSNNANVLIHGKLCPVRGAVSMDQIVVDVTAVPQVSYGDTAVLIGRDGDLEITVEELARRAKTIPYDILTGIGERVARQYEYDKPGQDKG